ncbi:unnamed protein product [Closterium sp. NIES-65]|nr:unnamed protein product [Closterium sp. NIES-65]
MAELTATRISLSESRLEAEEKAARVVALEEECSELRALVQRLEEDIVAGSGSIREILVQSGVGGQGKKGGFLGGGAGGAEGTAATMASLLGGGGDGGGGGEGGGGGGEGGRGAGGSEGAGGGGGRGGAGAAGEEGQRDMLLIVCDQRERFRKRVQELEEQTGSLQEQLNRANLETQRVTNDNLALYEKIRFLEQYNRRSSVPMRKLSPSGDDDGTGSYGAEGGGGGGGMGGDGGGGGGGGGGGMMRGSMQGRNGGVGVGAGAGGAGPSASDVVIFAGVAGARAARYACFGVSDAPDSGDGAAGGAGGAGAGGAGMAGAGSWGGAGAGGAGAAGGAGGLAGAAEVRYRKLYEEKMNPFTEFHQREQEKSYRNLRLHDKITLNSSRFLLTNKYGRAFVFFYTLLLHLFILALLYRSMHRRTIVLTPAASTYPAGTVGAAGAELGP